MTSAVPRPGWSETNTYSFQISLCLNAVEGATRCQDGHTLQQLAIKLSPEHSFQVTAGAFKSCLLLPMSLLQVGGPLSFRY